MVFLLFIMSQINPWGNYPEKLIPASEKGYSMNLFLLRVEGNLGISTVSAGDEYIAYFHVPVCYEHQVPVYFEVDNPYMINYRFIELTPPNYMVAATMRPGAPTSINWKVWVLVLQETWSDLPQYVPIPEPGELPDSVLKWLVQTDCAQLEAPIVTASAATVLGTTDNLIELADSIHSFCYKIPWQFPHSPMAFDAVYALTWGNSCTGHAHAAAALFRANGIPARTLMNCVILNTLYDHHWAIDFYVPDYGWVRMDPSIATYPQYPYTEAVTMVCNPEDEFPVWMLPGCEASWHTSDPVFGRGEPGWGGGHTAQLEHYFAVQNDTALLARVVSGQVYAKQVEICGLPLSPPDSIIREQAVQCTYEAKQAFLDNRIDEFLKNMQDALNLFNSITLQDVDTVFAEDFESGSAGWTHGGNFDEWELGIPSVGPVNSHSGSYCWGTDLDGDYEDNSDNWLLSPLIELPSLSTVYLDFWIWNSIEDDNPYYTTDYAWVEVSADGCVTFEPVCSKTGGINDDPEIPDVGGWSKIVLDLHKYAGDKIYVRFRFRSDVSIHSTGTYIDDVSIYGRLKPSTGVEEFLPVILKPINFQISYNPHTVSLILSFNLNRDDFAECVLYNLSGQKINEIASGRFSSGENVLTVDLSGPVLDLSSGKYFVRLTTSSGDCFTQPFIICQ
ncbi:choice-of-anchor J domain-containing protein [candidate division WOR-3 bacterium]|nr:choice-of-anchor J domain-containing protein [candidate division WOR-3 bacterium]